VSEWVGGRASPADGAKRRKLSALGEVGASASQSVSQAVSGQ